MADSLDSGSSVHSGRAGSSPASRTTPRKLRLPGFFLPAANITAKSAGLPQEAGAGFYAPKHVIIDRDKSDNEYYTRLFAKEQSYRSMLRILGY